MSPLKLLLNQYKHVIGEECLENSSFEKILEHIICYYENIIACMPGNVYWLDKKGMAVGCNRNVLKMFGLESMTEFKGLTFEDMGKIGGWSKTAERSFKSDTLEVIKTGQSKLNIEEPPLYDKETDKKNPIYYISNRVPLFDENNNIIGVVGISLDITDKKMAEMELLKEKEKAEIANKVKSEFLANMSHDIRTPLTGILGIAQMLQGKLKGENRKNIDLLVSASGELLGLLNEILELVQVETGQVRNDSSNFNLSDLVNHNIHLHAPAAKHKKIALKTFIDPKVPKILYGQKILLDRILLNLLSNAIKFTEEGEVAIAVKLLKKRKNKFIVEFIIEDTGIGIPKDKISSIFENFSRLTPSYEGTYKGLGQGLYIVKEYMENMQGNIRVESDLNKGTRFIVTLPLQVGIKANDVGFSEKICNENLNYSKQDKNTYLSKDLTKFHPSVLLVEDHPLAVRIANNILETLNCEVHHAGNGKQAIQKMKAHHYDLIFMDIGLPDKDGFTVAKEIHQLSKNKKSGPVVIALTAHLESNKHQLSVDSDIKEIITKPLTIDKARSVLEKFVYSSQKKRVLRNADSQISQNKIEMNSVIDFPQPGMLIETLEQGCQMIHNAYKKKSIHYSLKVQMSSTTSFPIIAFQSFEKL